MLLAMSKCLRHLFGIHPGIVEKSIMLMSLRSCLNNMTMSLVWSTIRHHKSPFHGWKTTKNCELFTSIKINVSHHHLLMRAVTRTNKTWVQSTFGHTSRELHPVVPQNGVCNG